MGKREVTRIIPYSGYEIEALEAWLDEKAREGLLLKGITGPLAFFRRGAPSRTRFRIDLWDKKKEKRPEEVKALYEEYGWEYVDSMGKEFAIFKTDDPAAVELNTDPLVLRRSMEKGLLGRMIFWGVLLVFVGICLQREYVVWQKFGLSYMVEGAFESLVTVVLCGMALLTALVQLCVEWRRRKRRDALGEALPQTVHTAKRARRRSVRAVLLVAILLVLNIGMRCGPDPDSRSFYPISQAKEPLPFPLLAEVCPAEWQAILDEPQESQERSRPDNGYALERSLLAPELILLRQTAPYVLEVGSGYICKNFYNVDYYRLRTQDLAQGLWWDLSGDEALKLEKSWETPGGMAVSQGILREEDQCLILQKGKETLRVIYLGQSDLEELVSLYERYLDKAD